MGNNNSSWFSIKTLEEEEKEKLDKKKIKDSLTEYDITMNTIKHENMFKGTIIICIVYAIFGFILLLLSYFSESLRDLLFNKFLYFTLIYIIGSIIIIFIMLYYIYTFEPTKINRYNDIDEISCPDYWKVEIIDDNYIGNSFDSNYRNEFKYRCVLNDEIFNKEQMFKYHNNKNYRMTNNFNNIDNTENNIGKYLHTKDVNFNADYINNKDLYNLYVDVNNYSTNSEGNTTTFIENKKKLAKDLNIYNDTTRIDNIYSNLRKIAVLENNYAFDNSNNAYNLLQTSNILNPVINFSIWNKNNEGANIQLNGADSNNVLQIINWNGLTNEILAPYFTSTIKNNVKALKIGIIHKDSLSYHSLGLIKQYIDRDDPKNIKYYFHQPPLTRANTTPYNTIFTNSGLALVNENDVDKNNMIFINTKLFKVINIDDINNTTDYTDYTNISSSIIGTAPSGGSTIRIEDTGLNGPYIQVYDKTKYNISVINKDELHNNTTNLDTKSNYIAPLLCDTVYPKLFARFENNDIKNENHNDIRCAYSKICGIPWSDLRCSSN